MAESASAATGAAHTATTAVEAFKIHLGSVDYAILMIYFVFVLGIGFILRRFTKSSEDFFLSGRSIPAWICGLAFISANLGAQEVMGMAAQGAKYGIMTSHFYWVGAIPAMVFLAIFMMPFYYGSRARSVPEYLKMRFDEKTRGLNAISFAIMTIASSGISMFALAKLLAALLDWNFNVCIFASAAIVLAYIFLGGLTSAIYNEVLQFFLIVLGFLPLSIIGLQHVGGWHGLVEKLNLVATKTPIGDTGRFYAAGTWSQSWSHMANPADNPLGVEWFGTVMGLGFVLSFGYWCTDFLVIQRAMAANSMVAARRTPLIAAFPKMLFPALVILPGMIAIAMHYSEGNFLPWANPADHSQGLDYNMTMPLMLSRFFPAGMLGLGLTALMASFMSGMAGNVTAFNTVFTYDLYQGHLAKGKSDQHYLWVGRLTTVWGILLSIGAAYFFSSYNNIMDALQLVFSYVNAPLFGTFLLGMFWRRATGHGAFWGLLAGTVACAIHHGLTLPEGAVVGAKGGFLGAVLLRYHSDMALNWYGACYSFGGCVLVTVIVSLLTTKNKTDDDLKGLVYSLTPKIRNTDIPWYKQPATLAIIVLLCTLILNIIFW